MMVKTAASNGDTELIQSRESAKMKGERDPHTRFELCLNDLRANRFRNIVVARRRA